jgi:hypothetical protein
LWPKATAKLTCGWGRVESQLNGETVMVEENLTRYRIGQFQKPVELRSGENLLVFRVGSDRVPPN